MAAVAAAAGPSGPEPMPSYAQLVQRGWGTMLAAARGCADCGWGLARRGLAENAHLAPPELLLLALGALGWTALRSAATTRLFQVSGAAGLDVGTPTLRRRGGPQTVLCALSHSAGWGRGGDGVTATWTPGAPGWALRSHRAHVSARRVRVDAGVWPGQGEPRDTEEVALCLRGTFQTRVRRTAAGPFY